MSKRGDCIRKRKDGRWEGRYRTFDSANGKYKYVSVYGHTFTECKRKLESKKENTEPCVVSQTTFSEILNMWLDVNRIKIKKSSATKYLNMIERHIIPELGGLTSSDLNATVFNRFLEKKLTDGKIDGSGGLSPSYVKTIAVIIESAVKYGQSEGYCDSLRIPLIKPQLKKNEVKIFRNDALSALEKNLLTDTDSTKLGIYAALKTGMRLGEICALKWSDIDFNENTLKIRNTVTRIRKSDTEKGSELIIDRAKTESSLRTVPISSALLNVLLKMKEKSVSQYVISDSDSFLSPRTFEYRYKQLLKKCGIEPLNFHALRHTFATRCIESGMDVKTLSELLGHAGVTLTLNTYVHSSLEKKRAQLEKLDYISA